MSSRHPPSQLGLFDVAELSADQSADRLRRVHLDETSWVEHVPKWLPERKPLLDLLARVATWEQRKRWMFTKHVDEPRLTAEYRSLTQAPDELRAIAAKLSEQYAVPYDSAWLNLYRDHRDSTSWHFDRPASKSPGATVPVLSLGETRRFAMRPLTGGSSTTFVVAAGDLIVMGGRCQRDWVHAVPKQAQVTGMRISVNFASSTQSEPE